MPTCWIIAGPNGAGKTTFAMEYLPEIAEGLRFINADHIAAGLSPLNPSAELARASRLFLREIKKAVSVHKDFAFETTLSGRSYLKLVRELKQTGWEVELIYLALPDVELSKRRVAERVAHGGHDIPEEDMERRFPKSLHNLLHVFAHEVTHTHCYLNVGEAPVSVFEQQGEDRLIYNQPVFNLLEVQGKT